MLSDIVCMGTVEILTGMQCEMQSMSHAAFATTLRTAPGVIKLVLNWAHGRVDVSIVFNALCGRSVLMHTCRALYDNDSAGFRCPVYAAATIAVEVSRCVQSAGIGETIPPRDRCSVLCSMVRRYKCGEMARALQAVSGKQCKILRRSPGEYVFDKFSLAFSREALVVSMTGDSPGVHIPLRNGVTVKSGMFQHSFGKTASDEFYRVLAVARSVCGALRITQRPV